MASSKRKLVLISTPIGHIGSGAGGGVELTLCSLVKGLVELGHELILVAPKESKLPKGCSGIHLEYVEGLDQPSWQHLEQSSSVVIPPDAVLPKLLDKALEIGKTADAILNFSYDWLPIWLTPHVECELFHLISMGDVSIVMKNLIEDLANSFPSRFAFHTYRQASDYSLVQDPVIVGNGFDLAKYQPQFLTGGPLGWAGRIAPEKGLEDAVEVAAQLGDRLLVWGVKEDCSYASSIEASVPSGTIEWRGFLPTDQLQKELGTCRALLNTPKWNEAYGNVVVEALACGVPVIAYDRGGPGELITSGKTGWLVPPNDIDLMVEATKRVNEIDRQECRNWAKTFASQEGFAERVIEWINAGLEIKTSNPTPLS